MEDNMGVSIPPVGKTNSEALTAAATSCTIAKFASNTSQKTMSTSAGAEYKSTSRGGKRTVNSTVAETTYNLMKKIGEGAHGIVYLGLDMKRQEKVALKTIVLDDSRSHYHSSLKRTLRELKILRLMEHENIVKLKHVAMNHTIAKNNCNSKRRIYMSLELMETDLATIIKSNQKLSNDHIQFFMYQLLRGLKFLHSANIIHRDIKPTNLLVNANCDLKICDFGLARILTSNKSDYNKKKGYSNTKYESEIESGSENECMTGYVETRWYRAPEVLLKNKTKSHGYGKEIDMWACGCVLAEMLLREAIFQGDDMWEQMYLIARAVGPVPKHMLPQTRKPCDERCAHENDNSHSCSACTSNNNVKDEAGTDCKYKEQQQLLNFIENATPACTFESRFPNKNQNAVDLCNELLTIDPQARIDVDNALQHPYLDTFHCPEDEPTYSHVIESTTRSGKCFEGFGSDFSFESEDSCPRQLEEMIQAEVDCYTKTNGKIRVVLSSELSDLDHHCESKYQHQIEEDEHTQNNNANVTLSDSCNNNNDGDLIQVVCRRLEQEEKREN